MNAGDLIKIVVITISFRGTKYSLDTHARTHARERGRRSALGDDIKIHLHAIRSLSPLFFIFFYPVRLPLLRRRAKTLISHRGGKITPLYHANSARCSEIAVTFAGRTGGGSAVVDKAFHVRPATPHKPRTRSTYSKTIRETRSHVRDRGTCGQVTRPLGKCNVIGHVHEKY